MCERWHTISTINPDFPTPKQEIYCCIYDGDSYTEVRRTKTDLNAIEDLLMLHPAWRILWRPVPQTTPPPNTLPSSATHHPHRKEVPYGKHTN